MAKTIVTVFSAPHKNLCICCHGTYVSWSSHDQRRIIQALSSFPDSDLGHAPADQAESRVQSNWTLGFSTPCLPRLKTFLVLIFHATLVPFRLWDKHTANQLRPGLTRSLELFVCRKTSVHFLQFCSKHENPEYTPTCLPTNSYKY